MKIPLKWIAEYTQLPSDHDQLIRKIQTQIGEVEHVESFKERYENISLAQIIESSPHPNAEKLQVYQVDRGDQKVQIVAGDKSLQPGEKVALFHPGAKLPYSAKSEKDGDTVEEVTLRGVNSEGMMASAKELALGTDHTKVMRIETDYPVGTPIWEVLQMDDLVLDVENKALTNRPDLFSIIGMSREISGILHQPFSSPEWFTDPHTLSKGLLTTEERLPLTVENKAENLCPRYMAVSMDNIKIGPSPLWMQTRLVRAGMRPINNIVDITNYVMVLTGQPLHAFDYHKLLEKDPNADKTAHITVRTSNESEKLTTLDGKTHDLHNEALLICDSTNPIAIAGVMGGLDTEIDEKSSAIVIESANFDMYNNRRTSMHQGIFTDAVTRFSKGLDPNLAQIGLHMAIKLINELASGKCASSIVDIYPAKAINTEKVVSANIPYLLTRTGLEISNDEIEALLNNVELPTEVKDTQLNVTVPTFRRDLNIEEDIQEEVVRLYGYDNVQITLPTKSIYPAQLNHLFELKRSARKSMSEVGASEVLTYNFVGVEDFVKYSLNPDSAYRLINALSPELELMRISLLPSLISKVEQNINNKYESFIIYEINKAHNKKLPEVENLPQELELFSFLITDSTKDESAGSPYYAAKSVVDQLLEKFHITNYQYKSLAEVDNEKLPAWIAEISPIVDPNSAALVQLGSEAGEVIVGLVGALSPEAAQKGKTPEYTAVAEINLMELLPFVNHQPSYQEPSRYPYLSRDLCFVIDMDVAYVGVVNAIKKQLDENDELLYTIEPVDIYASEEQKEKDQKQITVRINVRSKRRTLNNTEAEELFGKVISSVSKSVGGELKE